jgi:hypothetical protein
MKFFWVCFELSEERAASVFKGHGYFRLARQYIYTASSLSLALIGHKPFNLSMQSSEILLQITLTATLI